jgi:hypothetical protein
MAYEGKKPSMNSPDKGHNTPTSSSMPTSTNDYGMGSKYRGNDYNALYNKTQKSDASKLRSQRKPIGLGS